MKGSIRSRSAGSWELKFDIGSDPATGKRRTKFVTFRGTKREAERELRRLLKAVDDGNFVNSGRQRIREYFSEWLEVRKSQVSGKTYQRYRELVTHQISPHIGHIQLKNLRAAHLEKFYAELLLNGRVDGKGGLSPQTVKHVDRLIHTALVRARRLGLIANNPSDDAELPKIQRREVKILSRESIKILLKAAEKTDLYLPIYAVLGTGLRRGELLALRWKDLDLESGFLQVQQTTEQTKEGVRFKEPKTEHSRRRIDLPASLVHLFRCYQTDQKKERLAYGLGRNEHDLVFTNVSDGGVVNPETFTKQFSRLVEGAGIPHITFHGLRHTHISQLLEQGVHPKIAQERAGHASISVTLDIYSHAVPSLQREAAQKIDKALRTAIEQT